MLSVKNSGGASVYPKTLTVAGIKTSYTAGQTVDLTGLKATVTNALWIDTGNGGIAKYYDSDGKTWATVKSVWG